MDATVWIAAARLTWDSEQVGISREERRGSERPSEGADIKAKRESTVPISCLREAGEAVLMERWNGGAAAAGAAAALVGVAVVAIGVAAPIKLGIQTAY